MMKNRIQKCISVAVNIYSSILDDTTIKQNIEQVVISMVSALKNDKKILFCGNGGSAADAQHLAAELSGRFYFDRPPLYAEALNVNTSYLTAVANDFGYDATFVRMLEACGRKGDMLIGISTSGNSRNVVKALSKAQTLGLTTVGFTGNDAGDIGDVSDILIQISSDSTPRIQEAHILVGHIICQLVEEEMFPNAKF